MGDSSKGASYTSLIAGYMVLKSVINLVLGFSTGNIVTLLLNIAFAYFLHKGTSKFNYVAGIFLAAVMLMNVKANISGQQWFYLAEGIIDIICAAALFISRDIREYFNS